MNSPPIHTIVSRPGPNERAILDALPAPLVVHRRIGAGVALRTIEGGHGVRPVVFLHGRGHSAAMWAPILPKFIDDFHAMAMDLPGFGHSGATPFAGRDPEAGLRFFVEPIEGLLSEVERPILVGHSLGGLVALELALRGKVKPHSLVLVGAMGLGPAVRFRARAYLRVGPERIARWSAWRGALPEAGTLAALRRELHLIRGGRPEASAAFAAMMPLFGGGFHRRDRLREVTCPTLLLWGDGDDAFDLETAQAARAELHDGALRVIHAGHSPHIERPDETGEMIHRFVAGRDAKR